MNEMIHSFLAILKASLNRERLQLNDRLSREQWEALFRLASIHKVLPLVYEAVSDLPELAGDCPELADLRPQVRRQVMVQAMRTAEFLELNDKLQEAGLKPLVVKGLVCRQLYRQPDCRPSSDEDVLIPAEEFARCHQVLSDFGMETDVSKEAWELPYRKAGSPLYIELHKHLFPPESDAYGDLNRFFLDAHLRAITVEIQGHKVYTMGHTDHLFYLICHAFKHFLHSGFGIRQVCDILLYANAYGREVDWMQIRENCRAIRAERFAAAMFAVGIRYLGFVPAEAAYPEAWQAVEVDALPLLQDLLSGGIYGSADMSRKHSSNITLEAVTAQKQGKRARGAIAASLFPPRKQLEGRYTYLKRSPWLLPVAWCSRLWAYGAQRKMDGHDQSVHALKTGKARVELLRSYGILD